MNKEEIVKFKEGLDLLNIYLSENQYMQFRKYFDLLQEKNQVMNLTAITDGIEVVQKHFIDSLTIVKAMDMFEVESLIDVGTGAGFPAIPIKIAYPHIKMVLVDSLEKRVNFLNDVIAELNLKGIVAVHGRAEDLAHDPQYREKFEVCVARAVANLSTLSELCMGFVSPQKGNFIAYKAGDMNEEIAAARNAISEMGGDVKQEVGFFLPNTDISRELVWIVKDTKTPRFYPRKAGVPAKEPLD